MVNTFKMPNEIIDIKDELMLKIINKYGQDIFGRTSTVVNESEMAFKLFMNNINVALEIGTYNGITSSAMSRHCNKVITIDIVDRKEKYELWDWLGISNKIEFHLIKTESDKEKLIEKLFFDFCYIDGDHYHYTYSDWMMVRRCGKVLFHEYWEKQEPVWNLVNSLPQNEITKFGCNIAYWEKNEVH